MNIMLLDIDSKMPNLALMKISAYHKNMGDKISLIVLGKNIKGDNIKYSHPNKVYMSVIFKKSKFLAENVVSSFKMTYSNIESIDIGGSGCNLNKKLSDEIEYIKPDYNLYRNCDSSYGFTTRGCNRSCKFCIVPKKEGLFRIWQHPSRFYDERFNKITFFDNNILFDKEWFVEVCNFCIDRNLKVWFNQGLDIRLLDENDVELLMKLKRVEMFEFAWDDIKLESVVEQKIQMLKDCGMNTRQHVQFYVYVDSDDEFESGLYRCNKLKEWKVNAFVMFNIDRPRTQRIQNLMRWANRKHYFWKLSYDEYSGVEEKNQSKLSDY